MSIYGKGDHGKATKLHSEIIRSIGHCEYCGASTGVQLQCAHIVSRRYSATRTLLNNAFCLCASDHRFFTDHPLEFAKYVETSELGDRYQTIYRIAHTYTKVNWKLRAQELKEISKSGLNIKELRDNEWQTLTLHG